MLYRCFRWRILVQVRWLWHRRTRLYTPCINRGTCTWVDIYIYDKKKILLPLLQESQFMGCVLLPGQIREHGHKSARWTKFCVIMLVFFVYLSHSRFAKQFKYHSYYHPLNLKVREGKRRLVRYLNNCCLCCDSFKFFLCHAQKFHMMSLGPHPALETLFLFNKLGICE